MWGREHDVTHHLINPAHLSGLPGRNMPWYWEKSAFGAFSRKPFLALGSKVT